MPDQDTETTPPGERGDVRAGPGDAGAQDTPRALDPPRKRKAPMDTISCVILAIGIAVPVLFIVLLLV